MVQKVTAMSLPEFIGMIITIWLYGATCVQVYQYYCNFSADRSLFKISVAFIFVLETVHAALGFHFLYFYLIEHYGISSSSYCRPLPLIVASVASGIVIAWIVNQFSVYKIYVLSGKKLWLSVVISVLAAVRPVVIIAGSFFVGTSPSVKTFVAHTRWLMTTLLGIEVIVDGLIAICISYFLLRGRKKVVVFTSTRNIINTLIKYTLQTGVILMIVASLELIETVRGYGDFLGFFHILTQLYANCFLTMLNARHNIRYEMENRMSGWPARREV